MNVRPPIESSNPTAVLSVSFNSDSSCFAVGLESGICSKFLTFILSMAFADLDSISYKIMSSQGVKRYASHYKLRYRHIYSHLVDFNAGIGLVQMMGMTNYLALVGGGRSPKFAMNKASH